MRPVGLPVLQKRWTSHDVNPGLVAPTDYEKFLISNVTMGTTFIQCKHVISLTIIALGQRM